MEVFLCCCRWRSTGRRRKFVCLTYWWTCADTGWVLSRRRTSCVSPTSLSLKASGGSSTFHLVIPAMITVSRSVLHAVFKCFYICLIINCVQLGSESFSNQSNSKKKCKKLQLAVNNSCKKFCQESICVSNVQNVDPIYGLMWLMRSLQDSRVEILVRLRKCAKSCVCCLSNGVSQQLAITNAVLRCRPND